MGTSVGQAHLQRAPRWKPALGRRRVPSPKRILAPGFAEEGKKKKDGGHVVVFAEEKGKNGGKADETFAEEKGKKGGKADETFGDKKEKPGQ